MGRRKKNRNDKNIVPSGGVSQAATPATTAHRSGEQSNANQSQLPTMVNEPRQSLAEPLRRLVSLESVGATIASPSHASTIVSQPGSSRKSYASVLSNKSTALQSEQQRVKDIVIQVVELGFYNQKCAYGRTSMCNRLHDSPHSCMISFLKCASEVEAVALLWNLKNCRSDYVLVAYSIDPDPSCHRVLVEFFRWNISSWFEYVRSCYKSDGVYWWRHLVDHGFLSIFGDVLRGLRHIYSLGYFSGMLATGVAVSKKHRAKLMRIQCPSHLDGHRENVLANLAELKKLMLDILLKPFPEYASVQKGRYSLELLEDCFDKLGLPFDLCLFLIVLSTSKIMHAIDFDWLLDEPTFWDETTRVSFARNFWDVIDSRRLLDSASLNNHLPNKYNEWNSSVPTNGRWIEIYNKIQVDKQAYREQSKKNKYDVEQKYPLHEMARFYRHSLEHYNNTLTKKVIANKIKRCKTDSFPGLEFDQPKRPECSNLLSIYQLCTVQTKESLFSGGLQVGLRVCVQFRSKNEKEVTEECIDMNWGTFKINLTDSLIDHLHPIQAHYNEITSDATYLDKVLSEGSRKAAYIADATLSNGPPSDGVLTVMSRIDAAPMKKRQQESNLKGIFRTIALMPFEF